jgi:nucleoside-diphosphate-sugar epimerase
MARATSADILIIGGSGFLSGTLARQAIAQSHRVWTATRGQRPLPEGVTGIVADRKDREAFATAIAAAGAEWDMVVDCIGFEPEDAAQDLEVFTGLACQLVFVSSDFVFDPAKRRFPQPVDSPYTTADDYGGKKRRCEQVLLDSDSPLPWTVMRPCHIYGPGSQLGCLPYHGRDPQLIARLLAGEPLRLIGGGHFLQQPIFACDLADVILSALGNERAFDEIFCAAGPEIIQSVEYYWIIADILDVDLSVEEAPVAEALEAEPKLAPFLCHRIYDLAKLAVHGLKVPSTPVVEGLREHVESML